MERIKELDHSYLHTSGDVLFSVCGNFHSQRYIYGMPYYFPTKELGVVLDTQITESILVGEKDFTKLLSQIQRSDYKTFIKENYPEYYYSPPMWGLLMRVDRSEVRRVFDPRSVVSESRDKLHIEEQQRNTTLKVLSSIHKFDRNLLSSIGIGGSILLTGNVTQTENDIDMLVYGRSAIPEIRKCISYLLQKGEVKTLGEEELKEYIKSRKAQFPGNPELVFRLFKDRWDMLILNGVKVDISFVPEAGWSPVDSYEHDGGESIVINARVSGISDSYYIPTAVEVSECEYGKIIITARGYVGTFELGQEIEVAGIEHTSSDTGEKYVVVDESNGGYVQSAE